MTDPAIQWFCTTLADPAERCKECIHNPATYAPGTRPNLGHQTPIMRARCLDYHWRSTRTDGLGP